MPRRIKTDVEAIKSQPGVLSAILNDDDTVALKFEGGSSVSIVITDDYPRGDSFFFCEETKESGALKGDMQSMYTELLKKMQTQTQTTGGGGSGTPVDDDGDGMDEAISTQESYGGMWDRAASLDTEMYAVKIDPQLEADMQIAKAYGYQCDCEKVAFGCRVSISIPCKQLVAATTAKAWGFDRDVPLVVQLRFERPEYIKVSRNPEVFVFQNGAPCRFGQQVRSFVDQYLQEHWTRSSGWVSPQTPKEFQGPELNTDQNHEAVDSLNSAQRIIFENLQRMGYDDTVAVAAAQQSKTTSEAVAKCDDGSALSGGGDPGSPLVVAAAAAGGRGEKEQQDTSTGWLDRLKKSQRGADPNKFLRFDRDEGFLCHLAKWVQHRIPTAFRYCVICDKKHLIGAGMFVPSVCERQLCVHQYTQLNMGRDATDSVATGGGVIDLLIAMFRAALESSRHDFVLNPYPSVSDSSGKLIFDPKNKDFTKLRTVAADMPSAKDFVGVENMAQLTAKLNSKNSSVLPLIEWIISSNRSHLVKLTQQQQLASMHTQHQFLLVTASPEKQAAFEKKKGEKGTKFIFHGSRIENWHSILRRGLKVMSGTKGQINGSAHGSGVYGAFDLATPLGYSGGLSGNERPSAGSGGGGDDRDTKYFDGSSSNSFLCVALMEVVSDKIKDHGWCVTIDDEDAIMTRFFFVYTSSADVSKAGSVTSKDAKFEAEIRNLVNATH